MLKRSIGTAFGLSLMLLSSTVAAQDQPAAPSATPEQIAAARGTADRLIAAAEADDLFVNSTKDGVPTVTHKLSGMSCRFNGNASDRIMVFPVQSGAVPRGYDVGCVSRDEALDFDLTLYATRYRPLPSEEQDLAATVQGIVARWPDAKPHEGELASVQADGQPAPQTAAYDVRLNGADKLTLAIISHRDEWAFKARATGPGEQAPIVSLYAHIMFVSALADRTLTTD